MTLVIFSVTFIRDTLLSFSDTCYISVTLVIFQWHLLYFSDTCYFSVTFVIFRWHLLFFGDICYFSVTLVIFRWHLLYFSDTCYFSVTFVRNTCYLSVTHLPKAKLPGIGGRVSGNPTPDTRPPIAKLTAFLLSAPVEQHPHKFMVAMKRIVSVAIGGRVSGNPTPDT